MQKRHFDKTARIIDNIEIRPNIFLMRLACPDICSCAHPGQFCMVRSGLLQGLDPLLRRPLSIHRCHEDRGEMEFLFRVVGRGTKALSLQTSGQEVEVLGPLGKGFDPRPTEIPILVGGGLGVAPLLFLAETLSGKKGVAILGAMTKGDLLRLEPFKKTGLEILVATEDGSFGNKGLVTSVLERLLAKLDDKALRDVAVFACGPHPMLKAVFSICKNYGIKCQVALETTMACGSGLCLGCAVKSSGGYMHVCKDGPCFDASRLLWE